MKTPYETLAEFHATRIYTKGAHKGDAPLDKRSKSHLRVIKYDASYAVRFHNTDILTVEPSGSVYIDCEGWANRPTTQAAVNDALSVLFSYRKPSLGSSRIFNHSQLVLYRYIPNKGYEKFKYYDGMSLDAHGEIQSELKCFQRKQTNKAQVAAFTANIKESGFKDVFKVMHAGIEVPSPLILHAIDDVATLVSSNEYAEDWPKIISNAALDWTYSYTLGRRTIEVRSAAATWTNIMRDCKKKMFEIIDTDVFVVI